MMNSLKKVFSIFLCSIICVTCFYMKPITAQAHEIVDCSVTFYTKPATPCFSQPDVTSPIITYLDKFLPVNVTGIVDNQFFRVNIGADVYIPIQYLSDRKNNKSKDQIEKDQITDYANAYKMVLEQLSGMCHAFGLLDITGDGIPELITDTRQIYTVYNKKPALVYYSTYDCNMYYNKSKNQFASKFGYDGKTHWEVYTLTTSPVPSGYFICMSTDISPYQNGLKQIVFPLDNNSDTIGELFDHLYHLTGHGDLCKKCKKNYS